MKRKIFLIVMIFLMYYLLELFVPNVVDKKEQELQINDINEIEQIQSAFNQSLQKENIKNYMTRVKGESEVYYMPIGSNGKFSFIENEKWYPMLNDEIKKYINKTPVLLSNKFKLQNLTYYAVLDEDMNCKIQIGILNSNNEWSNLVYTN